MFLITQKFQFNESEDKYIYLLYLSNIIFLASK